MSNGPNPNVLVDTSILSDAWEILKRKAGLIIAYSIVTTVISYVFSLLWQTILPIEPDIPPDFQPESLAEVFALMGPMMGWNLLINLFNQVIYSALMAGLIIFCIKEIRTRDASFSDFFEGFNFFLPAFAVVFMTSLASFIGILACCIGVFFTTALCMFALPLVVDRNRGPWEAITESWRVLGSQWGQSGLFYFLAFLISISGILICCIGVIWTAPFVSIASAVLYTKFYDSPAVEGAYGPYVRETRIGSMPTPPTQQGEEQPRPPMDDPLSKE